MRHHQQLLEKMTTSSANSDGVQSVASSSSTMTAIMRDPTASLIPQGLLVQPPSPLMHQHHPHSTISNHQMFAPQQPGMGQSLMIPPPSSPTSTSWLAGYPALSSPLGVPYFLPTLGSGGFATNPVIPPPSASAMMPHPSTLAGTFVPNPFTLAFQAACASLAGRSSVSPMNLNNNQKKRQLVIPELDGHTNKSFKTTEPDGEKKSQLRQPKKIPPEEVADHQIDGPARKRKRLSKKQRRLLAGGAGAEEANDRDFNGEERLAIQFESYGSIDPQVQVKLGANKGFIPHGLSGFFNMYAERWAFEVRYSGPPQTCKDGKPRVLVEWSIKSHPHWKEFHRVVETVDEAQTRETRGFTLCNRVFREAMQKRAEEYEQLAKAEESCESPNPLQIANYQRQAVFLRPEKVSEGPLLFGLRHKAVQDHIRQHQTRLSSSTDSSKFLASSARPAIKEAS